ncbi:MAG TPA: D-glucuronyl C5-epimerase family protein [Dongiaceae bacterium]|nr:D-glucuronyl C5-epimerase family protein [Dongiaceae bacterium]
MSDHLETSISETLRFALTALRTEIWDFEFRYPLDMDSEAGPPESLHYYLYSENLSWDVMVSDSSGIPRVRHRLYGEAYAPGYIAWWGLVHLGHFLRHGDEASREVFLKQVDWLESFATVREDGAVIWPNPFHLLEGATLICAPWPSAHTQGQVISALVRAHRLTKRPGLLELLRGSSRVFELTVEDGGVRIPLTRGALYTEKPGTPVPVILDGFQTALLGLYDLATETKDSRVNELFREGVDGLKLMLPQWNYRGKWSWYGARAYLCPPGYHKLNYLQMMTLERLTADETLAHCAQSWSMERLSWADRAEIYTAFLFTKNAHRIKHRTWKQNRRMVKEMILRTLHERSEREERECA